MEYRLKWNQKLQKTLRKEFDGILRKKSKSPEDSFVLILIERKMRELKKEEAYYQDLIFEARKKGIKV
jgi:hypothetical protein